MNTPKGTITRTLQGGIQNHITQYTYIMSSRLFVVHFLAPSAIFDSALKLAKKLNLDFIQFVFKFWNWSVFNIFFSKQKKIKIDLNIFMAPFFHFYRLCIFVYILAIRYTFGYRCVINEFVYVFYSFLLSFFLSFSY